MHPGIPLTALAAATLTVSAAVSTARPKEPSPPFRTETVVAAADSADLVSWTVVSAPRSTEIQARLQSSVFATTPYFTSVRLDRSYGASKAACGTFPLPVLTDDGTARYWTYSMKRPSTGACGAQGGGDYVVVGIRGSVEHRTQSTP